YAVVAVFAGLSWRVPEPGRTIWLATAGLVLVVAVVEASYMMAYRDGLTELPALRALTEALLRLSRQFAVARVGVDRLQHRNNSHAIPERVGMVAEKAWSGAKEAGRNRVSV